MPTKSARVKSNWKSLQSKNKTRKKVKLAVIVLGLLVGLILVSIVVRLVNSFFSPIKSFYKKNYSWDGKFNINLLIRSKDISLLSLNPTDSSVIVFKIPDETFVEAPFGFGPWQLRAVYDLGENQKGLGGDKLLKETLTPFLGIPIDGFLDFALDESSSQIINTLRQNPVSGLNLFANLKTNLSVWELIQLKFKLNSVRFDKISELDLIKTNVLTKDQLSDGTSIFTSDTVKLDSILSSLADPRITEERKSIAVLNATNYPQLAGKWARLITNLGGNVIITANSSKKLVKTQVVGEESATLQRLRQIFELDCQNQVRFGQNKQKCDRINPLDEELVNQRAQITVFLGEDYSNR